MKNKIEEIQLCPKHKVPLDVESDCHVCHGEGEIEEDDYGHTFMVVCYACKGSGIGLPDCEFCLEEDANDI